MAEADPYDISQDDEFIKEQKTTSKLRYSSRIKNRSAPNISKDPLELEEDVDDPKPVENTPNNFPCPNCARVFQSFIGRQRHMLKNCLKNVEIKKEGEGKCDCCGELLETAHQVGEIICDDCGSRFKTASILARHREYAHAEQVFVKCPECDFFCKPSALPQHLYVHAGEKPFSCVRCNMLFTRKYHLTRHIKQTGCDGVNRPTFNCQVCGKLFNRKDNLREHLRAHAGVNRRRRQYNCDFCQEIILGAHNYIQHKKEHTGNKSYLCPHCNKGFATSGAQKKHIRTHTGEKPYSCAECGKRFGAKEILNRHMRTHTGVRPYKCEYCPKSFIQSTQLKAHVFYHTGENAFQCTLCNESFNRKARLDVHVKYTHEGAEPFECSDCSKKFARKEDLQRHSLTHTGVKDFKCDKCEKCFAVKSSLKLHLLTHTKEPPRACNYCNRAFIRQDCLLRHMRAKHRNRLEEILIAAEKKKLQFQLLTMSSNASKGQQIEPANNENTLSESVGELLKLLVDEETLQSFGAPSAPVDSVLGMVIKRCGHEPVEDPQLSPIDRLRANSKLLFTVVIDDAAVKTLLNNQTVDEVIQHVLKLAKT